MNVFQDVVRKICVQLPINATTAVPLTTIVKLLNAAVIVDALTKQSAMEIKTKEIIANTVKNAKV
tara:strand:+ start:513 stop:707 length:195 start_codon:yes stop_codon:yes gene_type:complete